MREFTRNLSELLALWILELAGSGSTRSLVSSVVLGQSTGHAPTCIRTV
jgi:hypothetical protein